MTAGDRNAGTCADRFAASEHRANRFHGQLVHGHADQRQREQRAGAHRVHVRDRIGRGNCAEVECIVDDGHEKIRRRDDRLRVIEAIHGGIVRRFGADEQILRHDTRRFREQLAQHTGRNLAAASAAVTEPGEANGGVVGSVHDRGW